MTRLPLYVININISVMHCRRAGDEGALVMRPKRANVCWPMVFDGGFRVREADAETDGKCHRGQARRARQEPDALRFEREIRVFPALAQTSTKNDCGHNAEASVRRVCGWNEVEDTVSPCPPSEDLEDLEQSGKAFNSGEEKAGSIKLIGRADTLPTEGFYD